MEYHGLRPLVNLGFTRLFIHSQLFLHYLNFSALIAKNISIMLKISPQGIIFTKSLFLLKKLLTALLLLW